MLYLALKMGRPLFLEGEAGVGKTEIAKVLSAALGRKLIRLQCYEGLDVSAAVYEWNYGAQMIAIRLAEAEGEGDRTRIEHDIFSERFLIKRPLLQALEPDPAGPPVLLIDEIDRTDEAFEAFLLEVLADFQVTVPELGTVKAAQPPIVVVTSNRTREVHDALKRRCLYHWVGYPTAERELKILRAKVPGIPKKLSEQVVGFVQALRKEDLFKSPGVAETLDWAGALTELDAVALDPATVSDTLGALLKYQDDIARLDQTKVKALLDEVKSEMRAAEFEGGRTPFIPAQRNPALSPASRTNGWAASPHDNILYFARALRAAGMPVGPGAVLDALEALSRRARRRPRRLLLDAACSVREAARAQRAVRPGLPHLLPQARLYREADRRHAAGNRRRRSQKPPPPGAQRIQEALFSGLDRARRTDRRSRSTRGSQCPTARSCAKKTSRR